ncbi:unnamed protein product [Effrenium voratum]|nr:unnamed protein product [Effrenium voratum]
MSLVLKIMKADLTKNFDKFGRMDPFAVVEWRTSDDSFVLSKTRKDWNSHMNPVWEHTCRPRPFEGNETIRIEVFDANMVSQNTPCGVMQKSKWQSSFLGSREECRVPLRPRGITS